MRRIAMIEDDPDVVELVTKQIENAPDMEMAWIASNFSEGLAAIDQGGFDVLLCDLGLPDGNGIDLIVQCKQVAPQVDVIVMTSFAEQSKILRTLRAGARSYILKDESLEDCTSAIRETISGGSAISPAIARQLVKLVQQDNPQTSSDEGHLTKRELEILNFLARGFSVPELSEILKLSKNTIATHVKSIYKKLAVNSRTQAVYEASSRGFIDNI